MKSTGWTEANRERAVKQELWLLHDVVELQHGVGRRIDEDVRQRVLVVVHLVCKRDTRDPSEPLPRPPRVTLHQPGNEPSHPPSTFHWGQRPSGSEFRDREFWGGSFPRLTVNYKTCVCYNCFRALKSSKLFIQMDDTVSRKKISC